MRNTQGFPPEPTGMVDAAVWQGGLAGRGHARFLETLIFNEL